MAEVAYSWRPIQDLPDGYEEMAEPDLHQLARVWQEQKEELTKREALKQFNERLLRRWAIETGIIERVYTLDKGVTQLLVERGLDASLIPSPATNKNPELVIRIIRDQHAAAEGLFDFVRQRRRLSTAYVKELHALLLAHQRTVEAVDPEGRQVEMELQTGAYKTLPNNPLCEDGRLHEYCPPEHSSTTARARATCGRDSKGGWITLS